jgi:hypothetical protein
MALMFADESFAAVSMSNRKPVERGGEEIKN